MPQTEFPKLTGPRNERVYELRSYEGASEKLSTNKIQQINEGSAKDGSEITIFNRLNFNTVFIGGCTHRIRFSALNSGLFHDLGGGWTGGAGFTHGS